MKRLISHAYETPFKNMLIKHDFFIKIFRTQFLVQSYINIMRFLGVKIMLFTNFRTRQYRFFFLNIYIYKFFNSFSHRRIGAVEIMCVVAVAML